MPGTYLFFKELPPQLGICGRQRPPQVSVPLPNHVSPPAGLDSRTWCERGCVRGLAWAPGLALSPMWCPTLGTWWPRSERNPPAAIVSHRGLASQRPRRCGRGGFSPGCAFCSEQLGCVVDHSGLILVLSTEGTGFFICELFKSLKTCLKRNMALKILGVITYEQHFYF